MRNHHGKVSIAFQLLCGVLVVSKTKWHEVIQNWNTWVISFNALMNTVKLDKRRGRERTARAYCMVAWAGSVTHQRREKGMCHGEFLYLVSEGESPMSPSMQEAVLHPQLAKVCHNDPWRARALWDEDNWGAGLNIQQNPGSPLRMIPHLQDEDRLWR